MTKNPVLNSRSKHIHIDFHFVREKVDARELVIRHIRAEDQIADVFTKALSSLRFDHLRSKLHVSLLP